MRSAGHRVLVAEDDPNANEITCAILRSHGHAPRAVFTVEQALSAIEEEEFCFFVLDQQLPLSDADPKPLVTGGERLTVAARASDPRRAAGEGHVTPILVLTGYSARSGFVSGLFKRGIDAFVEKDVCDRVEEFSAEVQGMLARAGRDDHATCAALAQRGLACGSAPPGAGGVAACVRLGLDGDATGGRRTTVSMNGVVREMQDSRFAILLRCAVAHLRSAGTWTGRDALGIGSSRSATTQIRQTFDGLVPEGFEVLEGDGRGSVRLNPAIVLEPVDFEALAKHPDPAVARIAQDQTKRR
jgi:CheY-like chemotaxis protein